MMSRNIGAKGDEEPNFTISEGEDDDSRGRLHNSKSREYNKWLLNVFIKFLVGLSLFIYFQIKFKAIDPKIVVPQPPIIVQPKIFQGLSREEYSVLVVTPPVQNEPDAMGCYHSLPEHDLSKHIVPPPPGPVKLVCCQSTKGEISCTTTAVLLSQLCCGQHCAPRRRNYLNKLSVSLHTYSKYNET